MQVVFYLVNSVCFLDLVFSLSFFLIAFCQQVVVEDISSSEEWTFPCQQWLDESEGDGRTQRDLHASEEVQKKKRAESAQDFNREHEASCTLRQNIQWDCFNKFKINSYSA